MTDGSTSYLTLNSFPTHKDMYSVLIKNVLLGQISLIVLFAFKVADKYICLELSTIKKSDW